MGNHESCVNWGDNFCRHGHTCTPETAMTNTSTKPSTVPVIQADRDRLAARYRELSQPGMADEIVAGEQDDHPTLIMLARHRIEHSTPDRNAVLPCDVRLPPATTIAAGCSMETLLLALSLEGRPKHFRDRRTLTTTPEPTDEPPAQVIDLDREALTMLGEAAAQSNWIPPEYMANDWLSDCATFLRTGQGATPEPTDPAGVSEMADELERHIESWLNVDWNAASNLAAFVARNRRKFERALRTPSPVLEVAKEALEPFAAADRWFAEDEDDSYSPPWAEFFKIVDFRRARAALQTLKEGMGR